jgi:hypothetical protein
LLPYTFQLEDFAEIRIGAITDVDQVGLHETLGGRRPDLKGFEERIETAHAVVYALDETGLGGGG